MRRQNLFRPPYLYDAGGDISKPWWVELGYRDPRDGKMKRKRYQTGFAELRTKKARQEYAEDLIKNLSAKLERGWIPPDDTNNQIVYVDELEYHHAALIYGRRRSANKNIRYYASDYISMVKNTKAKKTLESYRGKIRNMISWLEKENLIDNDIATFDNDVIIRYFDQLIESGLSKKTIEKYRITLGKFFRYLIDRKTIVHHPVYNIEIPETDEDLSAMPFLDEDMEKIVPLIQENDPQLFLAAMMQYFCFVRPGNEMLQMKVKQINFSARTVFIPKNTAKKRKERVVDIPTQLLGIMQEQQIHNYGKELILFGPYHKPGIRQLGENTLRARFNKYRDELNLSKSYKWYSFKHTGAGKLLESGATIVELMNQLGHTDLASTYRYIRQHFGERSEHVRNKFPNPPGFKDPWHT